MAPDPAEVPLYVAPTALPEVWSATKRYSYADCSTGILRCKQLYICLCLEADRKTSEGRLRLNRTDR